MKHKKDLDGILMNKKYISFIIFFCLSNCSFNTNSSFWTKERNTFEDKSATKIIIEKKKNTLNEFNPNFKIKLPKNIGIIKDKMLNNDGFVDFDGSLEKVSKYNFKKINYFENFEPEILLDDKNLFYFDNKGSIIKFDSNSKLLWKKNHYSKLDKKLNPILFYASQEKFLFIADSIANYYVINKITGDLIWKKKHSSSFNSQIKIFNDKVLVIDQENSLRCFSLKNGVLLWTVKTERSLLRSKKKQSIILHENNVFFTNSIGDITAVNLEDGNIVWQTPTQSFVNFGSTFSLKLSDLVSDKKSIFISNNKEQFFSVDIKSGVINWKQEISSELRPAIIQNYLITISDRGLLIVLRKETGEIIRVNDLFKNMKEKKKKDYQPVGFVIGKRNIYLTTANGRICIIDFEKGEIEKILKLDNNKLQRPAYFNKNLYIAKENSIIKLN